MPKAAGTKRVPKSKSKQVNVVAVISADGEIQGSFAPEPRRPLIAHFPFRTTEVQFQDGLLAYDPRPPANPEPYDAYGDDIYTSNAELLLSNEALKPPVVELPPAISESLIIPDVSKPVVTEETPVKPFRTLDVMIEYKHANETNTLPESVCAACFNCSGTFEGRPIVLPTAEENGVYTVYGNFCTLSCALSYLLNEANDPQVRWERQALLHRMYKQTQPIYPAPPRECLSFFGGTLSYEKFREIIEKHEVRMDCHLPPVISILATLDTKPIDFYETSLRNTSAAGKAEEFVKPVDTGLRLKRSKPLKDKDSTLDAVMNLHVKVRA